MPDDDGDELKVPYWLTSTAEAANTTFLRMLRRLPGLLRAAWLLGWRTDPRTTTAVVVLQLLSGAVNAVGLISVVGGRDLPALVDRLVTLLGDPVGAKAMGAAGRAWVEREWRWADQAAKLTALLHE